MIGIIALIVVVYGSGITGYARAIERRALSWTATGIACVASMVVAACLK